MTEIPEHLRKRAEAARAKAEAEKGGADEPAVDAPADEPAAADPAESRIPAHLLERSRAAKAGPRVARPSRGRRRRSRGRTGDDDRARGPHHRRPSRSEPAPAGTPSGC